MSLRSPKSREMADKLWTSEGGGGLDVIKVLNGVMISEGDSRDRSSQEKAGVKVSEVT